MRTRPLYYDVVIPNRDEDEQKWHAERRAGIGASEMPVLMGMRRYPSVQEIFDDKTGGATTKDDAPEILEWGNLLEDDVLEMFRRRAGIECEQTRMMVRSRTWPWMQATPDALTRNGDPVEVKTTSGQHADDWEDGVPSGHVVQLHQQMIVLGRQEGYVACCIGGHRLVWQRVEMQRDLADAIIRVGTSFWKAVETRSPERFAPPPAVGPLFVPSDGTTMNGDAQALAMWERIAKLREIAAEATREMEALKKHVRSYMGPAEKCVLPDGRSFSYRPQTRKEFTTPAWSGRVLRLHDK